MANDSEAPRIEPIDDEIIQGLNNAHRGAVENGRTAFKNKNYPEYVRWVAIAGLALALAEVYYASLS